VAVPGEIWVGLAGSSADDGEYLVEVGMVAGERLPVDVEQFVARAEDKRCTELHRARTGLVLAVAAEQGPSSSEQGVGSDERRSLEAVRFDDPGSIAVFVEQHGERHGLILDERLGVPLAPGPDRGDAYAGREELIVTLTDLTGPLPACQSPEMSEEKEDVALIGPQVAKAVERALRVG